MSDIKTWSTAAASNNSASPNGFPEGMAPSGVNDSAREMMAAVRRWYESAQWIDLGDAPVYASATTFTFASDRTATYTVGRRLKLADASTLYGTITACAYSAPNTTVTIVLDSGTLSGSLSAVALGILTPANSSIPTVPVTSGGTGATTAAGARTGLSAQQDVITTRGDLVRGSASAVAERLALGVSGQALVSDGSDAKWGLLLPSYLAGLQLSNNSGAPTTKIDVATGVCADSTNTVMMQQSASETIDCATTGALGLDSGSLGNSTWYHVFKIMKTDGTDSLVASTSVSSPTMPSGYTYKRRIGSFKTDGSAHILPFTQIGDRFYWTTPPLDVNGTSIGTTSTTITLPSVAPIANVIAGLNISKSSACTVYCSPLFAADNAASDSAAPLGQVGTGTASSNLKGTVEIPVNSSGQIRVNADGAVSFYAVVVYWIDRRGRDD